MPRNLQRTRVTPVYAARLQCGFGILKSWAKQKGFHLRSALFGAESVDSLLVDFAQWCYEHNVQFYLAKLALLAVQMYFPHHRYCISMAWQSVKSW